MVGRIFALPLYLAASILLISPSRAADSPHKEDAFLDQPLRKAVKVETILQPPSDQKGPKVKWRCVTVPPFLGSVTLLSDLSGKKVLLPKELGEWPNEDTETTRGTSRITAELGTRFLFEQICQNMGMTWNYAVSQDVILLSPWWQRTDRRSSKGLVEGLVDLKSAQPVSTPASMTSKGITWNCNAWQLAFYGLLSKPENFSSAGTLCVYHAIHGSFISGSIPVRNIFTGRMIGKDGHVVFVVLNAQEPITSKGNPGDLAYYLFNENGRFIKGGVYAVSDARGGMVRRAQADGDQGLTLDVDWEHFSPVPDQIHLSLVNHDLVFSGLTDPQGNKRSADALMRLKYNVNGIPNGTPLSR